LFTRNKTGVERFLAHTVLLPKLLWLFRR